ncbi:PD40 domain-containing protein [Candidatus Acetothermia bacterium]|nr:PD40 domain-containing protein [Candidatus Acetothermia bacterium]
MNWSLVHSSVYAVLTKRGVYFIGSILIFLAAIGFHQVPAQAEWLTMETPHFLITFQAGQESVAQEAAYYAELAHQKISEALEHEPKEKTQLVLVDSSDSANGFATPGLGYNMEHYWLVYGAPNTELRSRIESWLYTLAIHEYTHTLHIDMTDGWPALVRSIFGRLGRPQFTSIPGILWPALTSPNGDLPVTLLEGFAVYMETINTEGGRLKDSLWEMFMRADFVQKKIMTRDQSSGIYSYSRFTGGAPFYMYGAYFCDYIARTYGQKKLYEIMHENSKGSSWFINDVFVKVLGKSWPKVWAEFIAEAKERYAQQADQIKSQPLTTMERITRTGELATSPVYSPDGSQIAYAQGGRHREPAIRVMRADGKFNHTAITTDVVFTREGSSWSPDGKQLVYSRSDYVGEKTVNDLYLFDLDSRRERRLTYGVRATGPTWSPDGKTIVFVAKTSTLQTSLMAMDADDSHVRALIEGKDEMQFSSPRFSPDGKITRTVRESTISMPTGFRTDNCCK